MGVQKETFRITGMHCVSCVQSIEKRIRKISGVVQVVVNYANEQADVRFDEQQTNEQGIIEAIKSLGYQVQIWQAREHELEKLEQKYEILLLKIKVGVSILLSTFLLCISFVPDIPSMFASPWIMWLLATPVQFWAGWRFYRNTWQGLKYGLMTMDTLVVLGTSVAYFFSFFVLLFSAQFTKMGLPVHFYFDASATIITFILLGNLLEIHAKRRASLAIKKLIGLQPSTAMVLRIHGNQQKWQAIAIEHVQVDDLIRIKPGERIPVDGFIINGSSSINESVVTGESLSVFKEQDDEVIGGTVNITGSFEMRATKVGRETTLAKIIELVRRAQASKVPIQQLVDKVSGIFVPTILVLALISFIGWFFFGPDPKLLYAIMSMVSVLIIACPCALGLATPTSIIVGVGRGAQEGILIKDAQTLQVAKNVTIVVFDKTGTLTKGEPAVYGFKVEKNIDTIFAQLPFKSPSNVTNYSYLLAIMYAVEELSNHPISQAVIRYFDQQNMVDDRLIKSVKPEQMRSVSGLGLRAKIHGVQVLVGSRQLMEQEGIFLPPDVDACAIQWSKEAKSISFIALDNFLVAYFCVTDAIRDGVSDTIAKLKRHGIHTIMITGDNQLAAQAVAKSVGITEVFAQVLPADKAKKIEQLRAKKEVVAMVGDGINDAPALAVADVGIAVGSGTDVALETAGIALLRNDIRLVPKVITLSRAAMRNIKQNLFWAFGYNIVLVPVAMGVLYPLFGIMLHPIFAGAAMAFSSLSVVFNALRLRWVQL